MTGLAGRTALVTGGGGELGGLIAEALGECGLRVAVGYRGNEAGAAEVAARLPEATTVRLDVTDPSSVETAFGAVRERFGPVTVLVNAAGILRDRPVVRMRQDDWQDVIDTNLTGAFQCAKQAVPGMLAARFGRIVSIGSISGVLGPAGQANYAAAKAGLLGMSRSLAREVGRHGVTVNVVAPGLLPSALTEQVGAKLWESYRDLAATRKLVDPADVARAVRFCLDCPSLTGQQIAVDGGLS